MGTICSLLGCGARATKTLCWITRLNISKRPFCIVGVNCSSDRLNVEVCLICTKYRFLYKAVSKYSLDNPILEVCLICTNYRFLEIIPNLEVCLICTNYRFPELGLSIPKKPLDVVTTISAACTDQLAQTLQQGPEVDSNCVHMTTPTSKHIALT